MELLKAQIEKEELEKQKVELEKEKSLMTKEELELINSPDYQKA